jgi:hypothetical protein
MQKVDR